MNEALTIVASSCAKRAPPTDGLTQSSSLIVLLRPSALGCPALAGPGEAADHAGAFDALANHLKLGRSKGLARRPVPKQTVHLASEQWVNDGARRV